MAMTRSARRTSGRTALNAQQRRAFRRSGSRASTQGTLGVSTTAPQPGPRTNWAELEAKAQQGMGRDRAKRRSSTAQSEKRARDRMLKANRRRSTGRTLARPGLKARQSGHSGVSRRHQTGTA
jgi:hypothetical protein